MNQELLWKVIEAPVIKSNDIQSIVNVGTQLTEKEKKQVVSTFQSGHYEMVTTFVWTKAMFVLKSTLAAMGKEFLSELLDRPDIEESSNIQQVVSEYEAIRLAEELGIVSGTTVVRIKNAMNLVSHFISTDDSDDIEKQMEEAEALTIIKPCFSSILRQEKIDAAIDFKNFRNSLEEQTLSAIDPYINRLPHTPYFFKRTTMRVILSIIKTSSGAQLENILANSNLIVPLIWDDLKIPEKFQVGRVYAELNSDGKTKAVSGLRQVLLKVRGFDFVPEDLRSNSFLKVANEILLAHNAFNNFYNEPAPVITLMKMGSVIPIPAFPKSMTAILSVTLGNSYGISISAQSPANFILNNLTPERWEYYFFNCISNDDAILAKLSNIHIVGRWPNIVNGRINLEELILKAKEKNLIGLMRATKESNLKNIMYYAILLLKQIGYAS